MRLQSVIHYYLRDMRKSFVIFFGVMLLFMLLATFLLVPSTHVMIENDEGIQTVQQEIEVSWGSTELAGAIFIFIVGIAVYREAARLFIQNGVSRPTMFKGWLIAAGLLAAAMTAMALILTLIGSVASSAYQHFSYLNLFDMLYGERYGEMMGEMIQKWIVAIIFFIALFLLFAMIGRFIGALYHRMGKGLKIAVSVGVPVFVFVVLPIADGVLFKWQIGSAIMNLFRFAFGLQNGANPYCAVVSMLIMIIAMSGLSWLLERRAPLNV